MTHVQSIERLDIRSECPTITYGVSATVGGHAPDRRALIVEFSGQYREGALGNVDAHFMRGVIELASEMWRHGSLVIDLTHLDYQRGDMIEFCLVSPHDKPVAVVVGPACSPTLGKLWFGDAGERCVAGHQGVFDHLADALRYLEGIAPSGCRSRAH